MFQNIFVNQTQEYVSKQSKKIKDLLLDNEEQHNRIVAKIQTTLLQEELCTEGHADMLSNQRGLPPLAGQEGQPP